MKHVLKVFAKAKQGAQSAAFKTVLKVVFKALVRFALKQLFDAALDGLLPGEDGEDGPMSHGTKRRRAKIARIRRQPAFLMPA